MSILFDQDRMCFHLSNSRISYIFRLAGGKYPIHVHWGRKVRAVTDELITRRTIWTEETFSLNETSMDFLPMECPVFAGDLREGMIHVIHENGMSALLLEYESHQIVSGKPALGDLPAASANRRSPCCSRCATRFPAWPLNCAIPSTKTWILSPAVHASSTAARLL